MKPGSIVLINVPSKGIDNHIVMVKKDCLGELDPDGFVIKEDSEYRWEVFPTSFLRKKYPYVSRFKIGQDNEFGKAKVICE